MGSVARGQAVGEGRAGGRGDRRDRRGLRTRDGADLAVRGRHLHARLLDALDPVDDDAIRALEALKRPCRVILHTDSKYVQQGISVWVHNWKQRGWKTADKKPVKNEDLWRTLDELAGKHHVQWVWIKGHAGHDGNERADELANRGIEQLLNEGMK